MSEAERRFDFLNVQETEEFARLLAPLVRKGDALLLSGELGAGKTVFARAFVGALGFRGEVPSPTFTLVQAYDLPGSTLYHFDLYRLEEPEEIEETGFDEALAQGVTLVEWPEKAAAYMPRDALRLRFEIGEGTARKIVIDAPSLWAERLAALRS